MLISDIFNFKLSEVLVGKYQLLIRSGAIAHDRRNRPSNQTCANSSAQFTNKIKIIQKSEKTEI